jgi:hypothetical protein
MLLPLLTRTPQKTRLPTRPPALSSILAPPSLLRAALSRSLISLAHLTRTPQRTHLQRALLSASPRATFPLAVSSQSPISLAHLTRMPQRMRLPGLLLSLVQDPLLLAVLFPSLSPPAPPTRMPPIRSPAAVSEPVLALETVRLSALTTLTSAVSTTDPNATLHALVLPVPLSLSLTALWRPLHQLHRPASFPLVVLSRRQTLLAPPSRMSPIPRLDLDQALLLPLAALCPFQRLLERHTRTTQPPIRLSVLRSVTTTQ